MDSLTQAALGAGIQGAMLGRYHGRKAVLAGAALATLPDLDVLIDYGDPISGMINHRGFSHSVFVLTAFALLLTMVLRRWRPCPDYGVGRLFLTLWLVLITHPLLDAFTSYGTQLWWPLTPTPTSWSSIFIIDPFFTLPLVAAVLAFLIAGERPRTRLMLSWALGICGAYLALSLVAKTTIEARVHKDLVNQGEKIQAMFSTPEPFNILLWRVVARTADDHYIESISSLLDTAPPERIRLPLNTGLGDALSDSAQLQGLKWFTDGWLRYDEVMGALVVSDLRMGLGTGYYSFRFKIAERTAAGLGWNTVIPEYWPSRRGQTELKSVVKRVWQQSPGLPLAAWEKNMSTPP